MNVRIAVRPWPVPRNTQERQALADRQFAAEYAQRVKRNENRRLLAVLTYAATGKLPEPKTFQS